MTKKERNEIYKKAYEILPEIAKESDIRICGSIQEAGEVYYAYSRQRCKEYLPELFLFYPEERRWFWLPKNDIATRLNILAFCIAMTE